MKRTAIYCRVSTARQAMEGDSIPAQKEALHKYIADHKDLVFVGEYIDDGVSGTKYDRGELQRLLDDVKAGKIDFIIFCKLDRWFRSIKHFLDVQDILEANHCYWLAIWEPMYDSSTPQGRMVINTMMSIAQFEAENTGQRIKQVFDYKRKQGEVLSGKAPFGFQIVNKHLVADDNADKARNVFEYYAKTGSLNRTRLFAASIGFSRSLRAIKNMLTNRVYIGERNGQHGFCNPIIDKDLFEEVQRLLKINIKANTRQSRTYIFSGLLRCAECGRPFTVSTSHGQFRYRCNTNKNNSALMELEKCHNSVTFLEHKLEQILLDSIKPELEKYIFELEKGRKTAPKDSGQKIKSLRGKLERLKELYIDGEIEKEQYTDKKRSYLFEIAKLEKAQDNFDLTKYNQILDFDFLEIYPKMSAEDKRRFWRSIIKEIRILRSREIRIIFL